MKFEEYYNELDAQPEHVPGTVPPPFVTPTRVDLLRRYSDQIKGFVTNRNQRTDLLRSYSEAINNRPSARDTNSGRAPNPAASATRAFPGAGSLVGAPYMSMMSTLPVPSATPMPYISPIPSATPAGDLNPAINADLARFGQGVSNFLGPRSTTNPSFQPMRGEQPALQMPGLKDKLAALGLQFLQGYQDPGLGFRAMPRSGPAQPDATPYPRPPFLNFRNWLDTGERGPRPLDSFSEGGYPAPANTPMPEAYDSLISGGLLS